MRSELKSEVCNCKLELGSVNFENKFFNDKNANLKLFDSEKFQFSNPLSKNEENKSVLDIVQSMAKNVTDKSKNSFKMFPPCIFPRKNLALGFIDENSEKNCKSEHEESSKESEKSKSISEWQKNILSSR